MLKSLQRHVSNKSYRQLLLEISEELSSSFGPKQKKKKSSGSSRRKLQVLLPVGTKRSWEPTAAPVLNDYSERDETTRSLSVAEYEAILTTPPQKPKRRNEKVGHQQR